VHHLLAYKYPLGALAVDRRSPGVSLEILYHEYDSL
jgi:hypothetical protein